MYTNYFNRLRAALKPRYVAKLRCLLPNIYGIDLRMAREIWCELGGVCHKGRMDGEEFFYHPVIFPNVYRCGRGRSCPRELCKRLRKLITLVI
jgi:hypothetical protein